MKQNVYIITGTSRGIGEAVARSLIGPENHLICISRTQNPRLEMEAQFKNGSLDDLVLDLNNVYEIKELMREICRNISPEEVNRLVLINNAGIIHPIRSVGGKENADRIIRNIHVNLVAAMLVTENFMANTRDWNLDKRVVNLLTGAARRPVMGWSAYCSAKAGLDMFTQCLALETKDDPYPVKVVGFTPGVVDTEMQAEIRSVDQAEFAELSKFIEYKEQGKLADPETVATKLVALMESDQFGQQLMVDAREMDS